ncbi:MAG: MopE-related protein [Nanoarchaeota archaeon]|nr:MopE-related protein [Nanoarchaeota archaeon]
MKKLFIFGICIFVLLVLSMNVFAAEEVIEYLSGSNSFTFYSVGDRVWRSHTLFKMGRDWQNIRSCTGALSVQHQSIGAVSSAFNYHWTGTYFYESPDITAYNAGGGYGISYKYYTHMIPVLSKNYASSYNQMWVTSVDRLGDGYLYMVLWDASAIGGRWHVVNYNWNCQSVQYRYYRDADADGYGNPSVSVVAPSRPAGYVDNKLDCNDGNFNVKPGAIEICNGIDDNCVNGVDEGGICPTLTYYCDNDNDGYISDVISGTCASFNCVPAGCVEVQGSDCDDTLFAINPGVNELCDGIDNNCVNGVDEENAADCINYYEDTDLDGYGENVRCMCAPEDPYNVLQGGDCMDTFDLVNPGMPEACDWVDNDCDGEVDENCGGACTVRETCETNENDIFHIHNVIDGHAELNNETNFDWKVCCVNITSSIVYGQEEILGFSDSTEAHVEVNTETNFPFRLYLDAPDGALDCIYSTVCAAPNVCVAGISPGDTELHVGTCDNQDNKVCCDFVPLIGACSIRTDCEVTENDLFHISDLVDAHAGLNTETELEYKVCCEGIVSSTVSGQNEVLGLSDVTDAHIEKNTEFNYPNRIFLSAETGVLDCYYSNVCELPSACVIGIAEGDTNTHAGSCASYDEKLCCDLTECIDVDRDGYSVEGGLCGPVDCDDTNPNINPGKADVCNGIDDDCNVTTVDGSGEPAPLNSLQNGVCTGSRQVCNGVVGWQGDYGIPNYEIVESLCDGLDNDCDGDADEVCDVCSVKSSCYAIEYEILNFDKRRDAHVELPSYPNFNNVLCCRDVDYSIISGDQKVLGLSAENDAHVQKEFVETYVVDFYLDSQIPGMAVNCSYRDTCVGVEFCVLSLSAGDTDLHVASCEPAESFTTKLCCEHVVGCDDFDGDGYGIGDDRAGCVNGDAIDCDDDTSDDPVGCPLDSASCTVATQDCAICIYPGYQNITDVFGYGDVGRCQVQMDTCNGLTGLFEISQNAIGPISENCNGVDDDCDGSIDNDLDPGLNTNQEGVCAGSTKECIDGGWENYYSDIEGYEVPEESCDNLDNDCDSVIDGLSRSCYTGPAGTENIGLCRSGTETCPEGLKTLSRYGRCEGEIIPGEEVCWNGVDNSGNGLDEDCDGTLDNGCSVSPGASSITVHVFNSTNPPEYIAQAEVEVRSGVSYVYTGLTNTTGGITFTDLDARDYIITATKLDYTQDWKSRTLATGEDIFVDMEIDKDYGVGCFGCVKAGVGLCDWACRGTCATMSRDCDGYEPGSQYMDYAGNLVNCTTSCKAERTIFTKELEVQTDLENVVRTETIVIIDGIPYKMVVLTYAK